MKTCTDKEYELKVFEHEGKHYILSGTNMWICDGKTMEEVAPYVPVTDINDVDEERKEFYMNHIFNGDEWAYERYKAETSGVNDALLGTKCKCKMKIPGDAIAVTIIAGRSICNSCGDEVDY